MIKSKPKIVIAVATLIALVLLGVSIPLSFAWFTDSAEGGSDTTLQFATVSVDASLKTTSFASKQVVLTPNELLPGNGGATRNLTITNTGDVPCFVRFSISVFIDGAETNMITATPDGTKVVRQNDGMYFYGTKNGSTLANAIGKTIDAGQSVDISLAYSVANSFGNTNKNKNVTVEVSVDATQYGNQQTTYGTIKWGND